MNLVAGTAKYVALQVGKVDGSAMVASGTVYVRLYDAAADEYWSADGGGQWEADGSITAYPTATHKANAGWRFQIPAAATASLAEGTELSLWMNDHDTEASITAVSRTVLFTVRSADLTTENDVNEYGPSWRGSP